MTSLTQNEKDLQYVKDVTQKRLNNTENALEKTKDALSRTQSSHEEIKIDFDKSLYVIKKHQEKIYDLNAKRKLLLTDLSEKEKGLSLKGALLKKAENSLKTLQQKAVKDDERSERLSELLEKAKNKMDELDHVIKDNQSVIAMLAKQLNDAKEINFRKAPLSEAYLPSSRRNENNGPAPLTTSTPLSASGPKNFGGERAELMSEVKLRSDAAAAIPGGNSPDNRVLYKIDEVEGLDNKYLEPTPKPIIQRRGLLRSNLQSNPNAAPKAL